MARVFRIGTRGSKLALEQANRVQTALDVPSEIVIIETSGDRFASHPLAQSSDIGFFTKEIEKALLLNEIDLAVHSLKDLPAKVAPGLILSAALVRDDAHDVLLVHPDKIEDNNVLPMKHGCVLGASSLRRQELVKRYRSDLQLEPIRGNVPTRIQKVIDGQYDATLLSKAGLVRLGIKPTEVEAFELNLDYWPCAPGQATIVVEIRDDDEQAQMIMDALNHFETMIETDIERSMLVALQAGCHSPVGAHLYRVGQESALDLAVPDSNGNFNIFEFKADSQLKVQLQATQWIEAGKHADQAQQKSTQVTSWLYRKVQW